MEGGPRVSKGFLNPQCIRVRAAEDAPRSLGRLLERGHGLAEIVERGAVVMVERHRVTPSRVARGGVFFSG